MNGSDPASVSISAMAIDGDLNMGAVYKIKTNHIAEATGGHGIVTDQLLAPALGATLAAGQTLKSDHITETTGGHGIGLDKVIVGDAVKSQIMALGGGL